MVNIETMSLKLFSEQFKVYISESEKNIFFFGVIEPKNENNRYTINFCKSIALVKKMIKKYQIQSERCNDDTVGEFQYFLTEINPTVYIPYLMFNSVKFDVRSFSIFQLEQDIKVKSILRQKPKLEKLPM